MNESDLISNDPSLMRLAHPIRCASAWKQGIVDWKQLLGPHTWNALSRAFEKPDALTPDVVMQLSNDPLHERLNHFVLQTTQSEANTEMGGAFATALYWRQTLFPQPHFVIEDRLLELLEHTDIADDIPLSMLKAPYPRCYIEFGIQRTCQQRVPNVQTGLHVLEGAYIETGVSPVQGPGIFITFTGSPVGKENALDDATDSIFLPVHSEEAPIREVLEQARERSKLLALASHLRSSPDQYVDYSFSSLKLLVKALLYLNLPDVRRLVQNERSNLLKEISAKKSSSKRAKAERQLSKVYDHILIVAPAEHFHQGSGSGARVKLHWRRGHYRMQAHGPQHSLRKMLFISPMLVGVEEGQKEPSAPSYLAR